MALPDNGVKFQDDVNAQAYKQAAATINKFKAEFNKIGQGTAAYEQNYWNENKDALQKQGWSYTPDANSAWGGTWTKSASVKKVVTGNGTKPVSGNGSGKKKIPVVKKDPTWEEKMTSLGYTSQIQNDGSVAFIGDGNTYYSNGKMFNGKVTSDYDYTKLNPLSDFHKKYFGSNYDRIRIKNSNDFAYKDPNTNYIYYSNGRVKNGKYWGTVTDSGIQWDNVRSVKDAAVNRVYDTHDAGLVATRDALISTNKNLRKHNGVANFDTVTVDGVEYPVVVTTGLGVDHRYNDQSFIYDPNTQQFAYLNEDWRGYPTIIQNTNGKVGWLTWDQILNSKHLVINKQGGVMNRINYFQQGGAAPQQDMQQKVVALVQAAMQGDQKATQTVNKIMEAAKAGDQQAIQLAQMIQQVAKQMQGQATAAKWGAKLSYIRSLKYANGGKACPTCQAGAPIKPVKKVEEKACGGKAKKAKKRYFGGWL